MGKQTMPIAILLLACLFSATIGSQLTFLAKANFFPNPGPDLPRIYIRNNGSVEPATAPIERTGSLYKLTSNIGLRTIEIQRDNIVLDGSDFTIRGNESWVGNHPRLNDPGNNGVIIAGRNNVTITRLNIENYSLGVSISDSSNISVAGIVCSRFNKVAGSGWNPRGIIVRDSSFVLIENSNFSSIDGLAIVCNGKNNIIRGNTVITSRDYSMLIVGSSNQISDNIIEGALGIRMGKADSNIIVRNRISGTAPYSTPDGNYRNYTAGIGITSIGIALFNCSSNVIVGNNITGFIDQAILSVYSCSNNTIYGNYMANNGFAIALQEGAVDYTFYGNIVAADSCKVLLNDGVEGTSWNNGTIGNYWGDYNGTDSNGDGIGDAPYTVNGFKWDNVTAGLVSSVSGQDNYPLMEPYDIEHETIQRPTPSPSPSPSFSEQPTPTPTALDVSQPELWPYATVGIGIVAAVFVIGFWKLGRNRSLRSKITVS